MRRNTDVISGVVIAIFTLIYFSQTFLIKKIAMLSVSSAFVPRICVAVMLPLSAALIFQGIRRERKHPTPPPGKEQKAESAKQRKAILTALAVLFAAILMMKQLGFILSMVFYLMASFITLSPRDKRNLALFSVISVVTVVSVYFAFVKGFNLLLPAGILG